jgi:predicted glycoside hydrolase/deacetylase ChbG (UPF0249 family)
MSPKRIALCADDYAIDEGASRAILQLVDAGRLSATSAMSAKPGWRDFARDIVARRGRVAIGLHLDLTSTPFAPATAPVSRNAVIAAALLRGLDVKALAGAFERQFDAFEEAIGFAPDHVDGHHHVHVFPQVRDALLTVLSRRYGASPSRERPLIRSPSDAIARILARRAAAAKALVVAALAFGFAARVDRAGFTRNDGFSGFSPFGRGTPFDEELDGFLVAPGPRQLVMCHPGLAASGSTPPDPLVARRQDEYDALFARGDCDAWLLRIDRRPNDKASAFADWRAP